MKHFIFSAAALAALVFPAYNARSQEPAQMYNSLEELPSSVHERDAEKFVLNHDGAVWIPRLCSGVLDSSFDIRQRCRFAMYLGKYKSEEGSQSTIKLIEEIRCLSRREDIKQAMLTAINGLGSSGTELSFEYLSEMTRESYWNKPCTEATETAAAIMPAFTEEEISDLRYLPLFAISYSNDPNARPVLMNLFNEYKDLPGGGLGIDAGKILDALEHLESRLDGSFFTEREKRHPSLAAEPVKSEPRSGQPIKQDQK